MDNKTSRGVDYARKIAQKIEDKYGEKIEKFKEKIRNMLYKNTRLNDENEYNDIYLDKTNESDNIINND